MLEKNWVYFIGELRCNIEMNLSLQGIPCSWLQLQLTRSRLRPRRISPFHGDRVSCMRRDNTEDAVFLDKRKKQTYYYNFVLSCRNFSSLLSRKICSFSCNCLFKSPVLDAVVKLHIYSAGCQVCQ